MNNDSGIRIYVRESRRLVTGRRSHDIARYGINGVRGRAVHCGAEKRGDPTAAWMLIGRIGSRDRNAVTLRRDSAANDGGWTIVVMTRKRGKMSRRARAQRSAKRRDPGPGRS